MYHLFLNQLNAELEAGTGFQEYLDGMTAEGLAMLPHDAPGFAIH